MTKIYVTKYAMTAGPFTVDAHVQGNYANYKSAGAWGSNYLIKKDFYLTPEEALVDCERRRKSKLISLEKQRKKIESMKFEIRGEE